jgi:hypothetical protein
MYFKLCSAVVAPVFDFQLTNKKIKFLWVQIKEHSHKEQFHHIFGFWEKDIFSHPESIIGNSAKFSFLCSVVVSERKKLNVSGLQTS